MGYYNVSYQMVTVGEWGRMNSISQDTILIGGMTANVNRFQ